MQGKLRNQHLTVHISSHCAHCSKPMEIEVDSDLRCKVKDRECEPVIFVPDVNLFKVKDDSIIDSF